MQPKVDALLAATRPISRLGDRLKIHWLAYPEARLKSRYPVKI